MRIPVSMYGLLALAACSGGSGGAPAVSLNAPPTGGTTIADVQGRGSSSPFDGQVVTVEGVVTGDFQEDDADRLNNLGGFFIQSETPDGDASTSDGIFVHDGTNPATDVSVGDRVSITGRVQEYFGETQIDRPTVSITGSGAPQATAVELPVTDTIANSDGDLIADLERFEGMLLRFPQQLTVTDLHNLERFGSVGLSQGGRLFQFTNGSAPDAAGYAAHRDTNARRSIVLDDGMRSSNPRTIRFLTAGSSEDYSIRLGDAVTGLTGNLRFSRGSGGDGDQTWRLMPTADPVFDAMNPRPGPPSIGGDIRIASFNVLNLFSTVDRGQDNCGPQRNEACRGADSAMELDRQLDKTVTALALLDADIVGLMELENNPSESLRMLVGALNEAVSDGDFAYVDTGTIHDDVIKTGFLYRTATVRPRGRYALLDRRVDSRFNDARNRPALAQTFEVTDSGAALTVIVNHLKSKGSSCDAEGDPNTGDGQGNCNQTRTSAAVAIADWIASDPTGSNDPDFLVIGDLNAYTREDPLTALTNAGLENLVESARDPYSIVFRGQAGALDHAFATASLAPQVVAAVEWHINADEPRVFDYNLEHGRDPDLFDPNSPYRASDHDPVVIGLDLTN